MRSRFATLSLSRSGFLRLGHSPESLRHCLIGGECIQEPLNSITVRFNVIFPSQTATTETVVMSLERRQGNTLQVKPEQPERNFLRYTGVFAASLVLRLEIENLNFFFATEQRSIEGNLQAFLIFSESICVSM